MGSYGSIVVVVLTIASVVVSPVTCQNADNQQKACCAKHSCNPAKTPQNDCCKTKLFGSGQYFTVTPKSVVKTPFHSAAVHSIADRVRPTILIMPGPSLVAEREACATCSAVHDVLLSPDLILTRIQVRVRSRAQHVGPP